MTRQEWWKQHAHVVEAYYKDGATIECCGETTNEWCLVELPAWNVNTIYRIKEEIKEEPIDTGGPAYPMPSGPEPRVDAYTHYNEGMTLLDYFAGLALQGMLANNNNQWSWNDYAKESYEIAQAMLAERKRRFHE